MDKAGNQEGSKFTVFSLDLADPASQAVVLQGRSGTNGWYVAPVALTLNGQDQESGLSRLEYRVNGQPWQRYLAPVEFASEGMQRIDYRAVDASSRLEATHTITVALDLTPPQIATQLPAQIVAGDLNLTAAFTVTDGVSGVLTTTVLLNGLPYTPLQPLRVGINTIEVNAVNGAGLSAHWVQSLIVVGRRIYLPILEANSQNQ